MCSILGKETARRGLHAPREERDSNGGLSARRCAGGLNTVLSLALPRLLHYHEGRIGQCSGREADGFPWYRFREVISCITMSNLYQWTDCDLFTFDFELCVSSSQIRHCSRRAAWRTLWRFLRRQRVEVNSQAKTAAASQFHEPRY